MHYNNIMTYYPQNMYDRSSINSVRRPYPMRPPMQGPGSNNRPIGGGGFLLPFALGFVSSPLIFGATRPRPPYYGPYNPYYPYY